MKQTLILVAALAALTLASCDRAGSSQQSGAAGQDATLVEVTDEAAELATGDFTPSGDPTRDAKLITQLSISLSRKMMNGESNAEETARVDNMIKTANEFYRQQGKGDEFAKAMTDEMTTAINDLAQQKQQAAGDSSSK
ncbi:MAG: hypothetical protein IJ808_02560 [Muribaculaceae bacterium]|nr:hypothetical protein [Muribaculaceae bacterium]